MNKLIKPIKKALAKEYGYKNVSVKNGSGTAWGWVDINIKADKPKDCTCSDMPNQWAYCKTCKETVNKISENALNISREALKREDLAFYTYSSDDGYGSEREDCIIQVNLA